MIKKLKIKFIIINMIIITALLVGIFFSIYIFTASNSKKESIDIMKKVVENNDKWEASKKSGENTAQQKEDTYREYMMRTVFFVRLDKDNTIIEVGGQYVINDPQDLQKIITFALSGDENAGIIPDENLRYLSIGGQENTTIAFADRTDEIKTLQNLISTSLFVGSASLLILLFLSLLLASWAVKPVERSWRQQRRFIADASHELKTPLTVILANTDIVLSHKDDTVKGQAKWLGCIKNEAQRMAGLVSDLLFLAKSDDMADTTVFSSINLSDIVLTCLLSFESVVFEKGKTLQNGIAPDIFVYGNEERLKQLAVILLDNAVKYSDENGTITVTLKEERNKVKLSVHNTGKPIDENHLPHIFERFYRADEARGTDGHGLGLAIAKKISENHNGKIIVNSAQAEGTIFSVLLPVGKNK